MWFTQEQLRKCARAHLVAYRSPIPCQIVSNGEYMPILQTPEQKRVEARIIEMADVNAKRLGVSRRDFLRTSSGMAVAFLAMNEVFGNFFKVDPAEAVEPAAFDANTVPPGTFIFDDQLHHINDDWTDPIVLVLRTTAAGFGPTDTPFGLNQQRIPWNPALVGTTIDLESVSFKNFLKEVFFDSVTTTGLMSGVANNPGEPAILGPGQMAHTRDRINEFFGMQRLLSQGTVFPPIGITVPPAPNEKPNLEDMERQVREFGIASWKAYPIGDIVAVAEGRPTFPWNLDDDVIAYPSWNKSLELGIKIVCIHTGLNPPGMTPEHEDFGHPRHVVDAAITFPGLTFICYHSGIRPFLDDTSSFEMLQANIAAGQNPPQIDWVTNLAFQEQPSNVLAELGTVFASSVVIFPELTAHIFGQLLKGLGEDRIVWGTDSLWYGSPQWQIDAFWRFQIPDEIRRKFHYPKLTDTAKLKILGLNSAKLYNLDVSTMAQREKDPKDRLAMVRANYREFQREEGPARSNAAYGWVRVKA